VSLDLSNILEGWDYDPVGATARIITADDGRELIQLRLDLGVLQMEMQGRPDGRPPAGHDSYLDYHVQRLRAHAEAHPDDAPLLLDSDDCADLLREGVQYYHRYLSLWHLKRYELCARDTARNLRLFAFVRENARRDRDKLQFDQWRPYVTMMHTRAVATPLIELDEFDAALTAIDAGIAKIEAFLADYHQTDAAARCGDLRNLKRWRGEVARHGQSADGAEDAGDTKSDDADVESDSGDGESAPSASTDPPSETAMLRSQLAEAVAGERYEEAAILRDEILRRDEAVDDEPSSGQRS
jgi:hypothetical protein